MDPLLLRFSMDDPAIPSGIFFIRISDVTGCVATESVVKL